MSIGKQVWLWPQKALGVCDYELCVLAARKPLSTLVSVYKILIVIYFEIDMVGASDLKMGTLFIDPF